MDSILKFEYGWNKRAVTIILNQILAYEVEDLGEEEGFLLRITFRSFVKDFCMKNYDEAKEIENKLDTYFKEK